ncbi:MAG: hypothetical protein ACRDKZ_15270 [Actinomycetota bacterium]
MTMLKPDYAVDIDGRTLGAAEPGPLTSLQVTTSINGPSDHCIVRVLEEPDDLPEHGGAMTVELGWDGGTETVFTGTIAYVERGLEGLDVIALGESIKLMRSRSDEAFLNQPAGQIVTSLAADAGVTPGSIDNGTRFSVYLADSSMSSYEHCLRLAGLCGFDLYTDEQGALNFAPFGVFMPDHLLRYGADILDARLDRGPAPAGVRSVPESPSSSLGADTSSWLSKSSDAFAGEASGQGSTLMTKPVLRTKDAAQSAATGLLGRRSREAASGTVRLMGSPHIHLGDALAFVDLPGASDDNLYQVTAVRHALDTRTGFYTLVGFGGTDA